MDILTKKTMLFGLGISAALFASSYLPLPDSKSIVQAVAVLVAVAAAYLSACEDTI